jgi:tRNA(Ile)-lysidine synthase
MPEPVTSISRGSSTSQLLHELGCFIQENKLMQSSDRVLCMVSGGADSTVMLKLLHALSLGGGPDSLRGFSLGICHVNYGLRGEASDADEEFVWRLGDSLGVQVHAIRAPEPPRMNFQAWAREFRRRAASNLCRWQGYTRIATGHNLDDRVETFLHRLITYSGRRSLAVMPPRAGKVIRPLLFMSASRIRGYCDSAGVSYREDESNDKTVYQRNRIRREVMPRLEDIRPDFRDRIEDTISLLEDEESVLAALTTDAANEVTLDEGLEPTLSAGALSELDRAIARLVLRSWIEQHGAKTRITRRLLDAAVDLCGESHGTQSISLSGGLKLERRYDKLVLCGSRAADISLEPVELSVPGITAFGSYEFEAAEAEELKSPSRDPKRITLDAERLSHPLMVRTRAEGDRIRQLGMEGTKTLQDLFVDEKVPRSERDHVPVITSGDEIVWVAGLRISDDFKVTSKSRRFIDLRVSRRDLEDEI